MEVAKKKTLKCLQVKGEAHSLETIIKFPYSLIASAVGHKYVGMSTIFIEYIPIITTKNHGSVRILIRDKRQLFDNDSAVAEICFVTNIKQQVEISGFDYAAYMEKSPYSIEVVPQLESIAEDFSVGRIRVKPTFLYTKRDPPVVIPKVKRVFMEGNRPGEMKKNSYTVESSNSLVVDFRREEKIQYVDTDPLQEMGYKVYSA